MVSDEVTTERLVLRQPEDYDSDRIAELIGNWNVIRWLARPPYPFTRSDAEGFIMRARQRENTVDDVVYAIIRDAEFIGVISISPASRGPNLGYWLGQAYWGQGLMTEAAGKVIGRFFAQSDFEFLYSGIIEGNVASLEVQRKLGFEITGKSSVICVSQGKEVPHVDTRLSRLRYEAVQS